MGRRDIPRAIDAGFTRLARAQIARPWLFVLLTLVVSLASGWLATRLVLPTRVDQLLPEDRPSVVELRRLQANVPAGSHVVAVLSGGDVAVHRGLSHELVLCPLHLA